MACRHEQAIAVAPAETEIGTALGQIDLADWRSVGREHDHAIEFGSAGTPAAPQIAIDIDTKTVRRSARACIDENFSV